MDQTEIEGLEQIISSKYDNTTGIVIIKDGIVSYEKYFKGCTANSRVHIYSVTKSVVSISWNLVCDQLSELRNTPDTEKQEAGVPDAVAESGEEGYTISGGDRQIFRLSERVRRFLYSRGQRAKWLLADIWRLPRGSYTPQLCCAASWMPRQLAAGLLTPAACSVIGICGVRLTWVFTVFRQSPSFATVMQVYPFSLGVTAAVILAVTLLMKPSKRYIEQAGRWENFQRMSALGEIVFGDAELGIGTSENTMGRVRRFMVVWRSGSKRISR